MTHKEWLVQTEHSVIPGMKFWNEQLMHFVSNKVYYDAFFGKHASIEVHVYYAIAFGD